MSLSLLYVGQRHLKGRRECDFSGPNPGPNSCIDGDYNGGLECDPHSGTASFSKLDVRNILFILRTRASLLLLWPSSLWVPMELPITTTVSLQTLLHMI